MASHGEIQFVELKAWMDRHDRKIRSFAKEIGEDKMTVSRLLRGDFKRLNPRIITKVAQATDHIVGEPEFAAFLGRMSRCGSPPVDGLAA